MELSETYIMGLIKSEHPFPIDFDLAWHWLGYARKDSAKRLLEKCTHGVDYQHYELTTEAGGGSVKHMVRLTIECFKHLAMQAGTPRGKEVRNYFIKCEQLLKESQAIPNRKTKAIIKAMDLVDKAARIEAADKFLNNHPDCADILRMILKD